MNYRIIRTTGSYQFHVVDSTGLPHKELTLYACVAHEFHSLGTARSYSREIVAFASWAAANQIVARQGWALLGSLDQVRAMLSFFLTQEMKCIVAIGKDNLGFDTRRIEPTWETGRSLERLFAALRSFYSVLQLKGYYAGPNPMEGDGARDLIEEAQRRNVREFVKENNRAPMHSDSGVDSFRQVRNSAAYFRLKGDQWLPSVIDDPTLFNTVLNAGEQWGWSLRETSLVRVLFDTGCRIHEACALTFGDWYSSGFQKELRAISKGSHGRRVKRLFISDRTVKVLQRYVDEERIRFDSGNRTLANFGVLALSDLKNIPLFINRLEVALNPDHFRRDFWTPALRSSKIKLRPHQVRHWFVTSALNDIHRRATSSEELQSLRSGLKALMAWRSDMLPVYDQAARRHNLPELANLIHLRVEEEHQLALETVKNPSNLDQVIKPKSYSQEMLDEMLGQ
jgi:integrase